MFTSKAGAAKTSAKITFINDVPAGGLTFQFVAPSPQDVADRQELQETLVPVIARNKEREAEGLAAGSNVAQGIGAGSAAIAESSTSGNRSRGDTPASGGAGTGTNTPNIVAGRKKAMPAGFSEEEIALKTKVLTKHPTLRKLHAELVFGKLVTDAEFWEGRQVGFIISGI